MKTQTRVIRVLTDGAAGNEAQALGLAEALARRLPARIEVERIAPRPGPARLPARLWHRMGARPGGWPFTGYERRTEPPWPDLVIGAGRRIAPLVAALRKLHGVKAVQILDSGIPAQAFDLVIAPEHDRVTAPNALTTLGALGRVTPARIATEAEAWRPRLAHLSPHRVACLIGGPSKSSRWTPADAQRLIAQLAALEGRGLMVTASRRSDPALLAAISAACTGALVWDGEGDNPYPAILGLAEAVIVTGDSVNMVSEAAASGLPLHLFQPARLAPKLRAFHDALKSRGIARDFTGEIGAWTYPPLLEADRIAAEVQRRLL